MDTPTGTGATVSADRLREAREYLGFSQGDVAAAMDRVPGWTDDIENGRRAITGEELRKLSRLYRRPVGWFTGEWEHHPDPDCAGAAFLLRERIRMRTGDRPVSGRLPRLTFPAREPGARKIMAGGLQVGHSLADHRMWWTAYLWAARSDPHMGYVRQERFPDLAELRAEIRGQLEDSGPWWEEPVETTSPEAERTRP